MSEPKEMEWTLEEESEVYRQRMEKLDRLRREEGYDPFLVDRWERETTLAEVARNFAHLKEDEHVEDRLVTAGRVLTVRKHGKASFLTVGDETAALQLYFQVDALGEESYGFFKKWVDSGDFIGVVGHPFRTRRGELSLQVDSFKLLSKALRPLPEKWHGLKDTETRYRRRYVDLIANPEVRDVFRKRSLIIATFRRVLEAHGTLEV